MGRHPPLHQPRSFRLRMQHDPEFLWRLVAAPDFLHAALDMAACAPFYYERRMKSGNAIKLYRKSGGWRTSCGHVPRCVAGNPGK
jgi:hypothetical protein